jgi:flagellar operon protein
VPGKVDGLKPPFIPIGGLKGLDSRQPITPEGRESKFKELLLEKIALEQNVKFSAHAKTRIESRQIELSGDGLVKIAQAMDRAQTKGSHDSLILMENIAFIANVDNRTIITAIDEATLQENVFTNIDSAVIVK